MFVGGWRGSGDPWQIFRPRRAHSTFRKDHTRGDCSLSGIGTALDDSGGAGLRDARGDEHGQHPGQRHYPSAIGLAVALLTVGTLGGCRSPAKADPATTWQNIRSDYVHGNLLVAQQNAEQAQKDFSASSADWALKFRLLEAEILIDQGRRPEVIALLNSPSVSYPTVGDAAIKRNLLCGLAHAKLGQAQQADTELQEAGRLSEASNSSLRGEVLGAEAVVQISRGHLAEGADLLEKSLKVAREQRNSFLETSDLLNLGFVALKLEHYDEGVALSN
jgi:tetratricopeptide (TPR) repeat protein